MTLLPIFLYNHRLILQIINQPFRLRLQQHTMDRRHLINKVRVILKGILFKVLLQLPNLTLYFFPTLQKIKHVLQCHLRCIDLINSLLNFSYLFLHPLVIQAIFPIQHLLEQPLQLTLSIQKISNNYLVKPLMVASLNLILFSFNLKFPVFYAEFLK